MTKEPRIRRSAGMLKSPLDAKPPAFPTTPPKPRPESPPPAPISRSSHPKPKVLMGEVVGPRGPEMARRDIGQQRESLRAFMLARHLRPSEWARMAGIPAGEILGFLTGKSRAVPPASLEKLARAANCKVEEIFR